MAEDNKPKAPTVASLAQRVDAIEGKKEPSGSNTGSADHDVAAFEEWRRGQFPSQ
jgi:hypothetical protein